MFIACGASASSVAMHNISNVGVARLVGGCIFPVGLMMIIFIGGELFTGDCMMIMGCIHKKFSALSMIRVLVVVYLANLVGSCIIAALVYFSGQYNYTAGLLGAYTIKVAVGKVNLSFGTALASGIMCNIFVCAAVLMAAAAKDISGKVWAIFFPIMAFVVSGYEHCVANMYYIPAGIFALNNTTYVEKAMSEYSYTADDLASLNWGSFLIKSALPVTLGNIIGGMVFVGLILYAIHAQNIKEAER
jgi:formate/nitrite transporter